MGLCVKPKLSFESEEYIILLTEEKLEVDLKKGAKAFLEYLMEDHAGFSKVLSWFAKHLFPADFYLSDISRAYLSPEDEVLIERRTPEGIKLIKLPKLTREQSFLLVETINRLVS